MTGSIRDPKVDQGNNTGTRSRLCCLVEIAQSRHNSGVSED